MNRPEDFAADHAALTRRFFIQLGAGSLAAFSAPAAWSAQAAARVAADPLLAEAVGKLEYLTPVSKFRFLGRGKPSPATLPEEKLPSIGLTREAWKLEVLADSEPSAKKSAEIGNPLSKEKGNALDFAGLMKLAERHTVRFLHVLTCTNAPQPFGMGLWEGVPLKHVIWQAEPRQNIKRIYYYGYHNDDPAQLFQGSLPIGRVLEEAPGELPVILCTKLNGEWLTQAAGGPVRLVAPGFYGNRSIKWLQRIYLTNSHQANDTYAAEMNNDVESPLKSFARFVNTPEQAGAGAAIPLTGMAQVGLSGLSKVQYWLKPAAAALPDDDPYLEKGDWRDAAILPPPEHWGGGLPGGKLPPVLQADPETGRPFTWPIPNTIIHWAVLVPGAAAGNYELRCRAVDSNGIAQPLPRPIGRSGMNAIQAIKLAIV